MNRPTDDPSGGWNAVAAHFISSRSPTIGVATVAHWASSLAPGASILDLGCGHGFPIATELARRGFTVSGVDASPELVAEFRRRLPGAMASCEAVESSTFFGRRFDAAIAIGLLFLLEERTQKQFIQRVGAALHPGGRFLFTAPSQQVTWKDALTGRESRSLGRSAYSSLLSEAGFTLDGEFTDEGGNHYYSSAILARAAG